MPAVTSIPGRASDYTVDVVKADGKRLYYESSVMFPEPPPIPPPPNCYTKQCIDEYKWAIEDWADKCKANAELFRMIHEYHKERCRYCMRHRNDEIDEKYIMGSLVPQTIRELKQEIKKLRR
jgi:hypothetical protein